MNLAGDQLLSSISADGSSTSLPWGYQQGWTLPKALEKQGVRETERLSITAWREALMLSLGMQVSGVCRPACAAFQLRACSKLVAGNVLRVFGRARECCWDGPMCAMCTADRAGHSPSHGEEVQAVAASQKWVQ